MRRRSCWIWDVRRCDAVARLPRIGLLIPLACLVLGIGSGCSGLNLYDMRSVEEQPLTASAALGQTDSRRDASLRLVIAGLDDDAMGRPDRAIASYQRAVRVDATNPFAYLALARHHLEAGGSNEAGPFLDQARALFESEQRLGPAVDVWGVGLRAWIDREDGRDDLADERFEIARELSPEIWADERLSADELR